MRGLSGSAAFLLAAVLGSVWISGCSRQGVNTEPVVSSADGSTGELKALTYEEMRRLGWMSFDELSPDDQAFLRRVLGSDLEELKGKKLLIKKSLKPTTTPIRHDVVPNRTSP